MHIICPHCPLLLLFFHLPPPSLSVPCLSSFFFKVLMRHPKKRFPTGCTFYQGPRKFLYCEWSELSLAPLSFEPRTYFPPPFRSLPPPFLFPSWTGLAWPGLMRALAGIWRCTAPSRKVIWVWEWGGHEERRQSLPPEMTGTVFFCYFRSFISSRDPLVCQGVDIQQKAELNERVDQLKEQK